MRREGAAAATRTILEYLIIHLRHKQELETRGSSTLGGTIVVSVDIEDSVQHADQSRCAIAVAAKGSFCHEFLSDQIRKELQGLLPACRGKALSGRGCSHESLHLMPFQLSFELCEGSGVLKEDYLAMEQFIHRISLTHTTVKFHYCVKVNGSVSAKTYSTQRRGSTRLPDGTRLLCEGSHFVREAIWSCHKIHPIAGEPVGLFIPDEAAERGFSGELRLTPVVSLCPCRKPFPNQPARIAAVSVFLHDPAGLPVLLPTKKVSGSFFEDPSRLAAWERYGYQATLNPDPYWEEDTAKPDVTYKLHASHEEDPRAQEQTLLLFLFLSYSDPFQDQPAYSFCTKSWERQGILSHLHPILSCSEQAVKGAIQGVINGILQQQHKVAQEQRKLAHSAPIVVDAVSSIVSSSTDCEFRRRCFQSLQVTDTKELRVTIKDAFSRAAFQQWRPSSACDIGRPVPKSDEAGQFSTDCALPSVHQKLSCSYMGSAGLERGGDASCGGEGLLHKKSDSERKGQTKKRKPSEQLPVRGSRGPHAYGEADAKGKRESHFAEAGPSSSSSFSPPPPARPAVFLENSGGRPTQKNESLWQEDDVWNQAVSSWARWTP